MLVAGIIRCSRMRVLRLRVTRLRLPAAHAGGHDVGPAVAFVSNTIDRYRWALQRSRSIASEPKLTLEAHRSAFVVKEIR
jgi:hypothetical protein